MIAQPNPGANRRVLVTGSTGFIGHYALGELVSRGIPCAALLRPALNESTSRLKALLKAIDVDLDRHVAQGRLLLLEGDINGRLPRAIGAQLGSVLHIAGCTDFQAKPNGDPWRTNVEGTQRLLAWAATKNIRTIHFVSSAYRCGLMDESVPETIGDQPPVFNNDYEHSKWQAEREAQTWARQHDASLTVYRPSIVVGDSQTHRTTGFSGFYVMARATQVIAQSYGDDVARRQETGIRVVGNPDATQDLVPVDYVAKMIATGVVNRRYHGEVYHLTHPDPPSNATIKNAIDAHFDVGGSGFIAPDELDTAEMSSVEQLFYDASSPVRTYLTHNPRFLRGNTFFLELAAGVQPPTYTSARLHRLIRFAESAGWGRSTRKRSPLKQAEASTDEQIATYFEHFLPSQVQASEVARSTAMSAIVRFVFTDSPRVAWRCTFVAGHLLRSERADTCIEPQTQDDFVYLTSRNVFWQAAAGEADPQRIFMEDRAQVTGDVESALRMAVVLHRFNQEFPCTPESLAAWRGQTSPVTSVSMSEAVA